MDLITAGRKRALGTAYTAALQHPKVGIPLLRAHCRLRPGFTDADPFKTLWIDPSQITAISDYNPRRAYGVVASGSWDQNCEPISELPAFDGLKTYYENNDRKRIREVFEAHVEKDDGRAWGHTSKDTFENRLKEIDEIYNSIQKRGYRTQEELSQMEHDVSNNEPVPLKLNEVTVDIGRNGNFLYCGFGSHRLAISKLLEIDKVCVKVGARHADWQKMRNKIKKEKEPLKRVRDHLKHPDLQDID